MQYRTLGQSGILLSTVGISCSEFHMEKDGSSLSEKEIIQIIHAGMDFGVNYFDCSTTANQIYAASTLGTALQGRRGEAVIGAAVNVESFDPEQIRNDCETVLSHLQTDYIDIYSLSLPNRQVPLSRVWRVLESLVESGKVRSLGVHHFSIEELTEAVKFGNIVANQVAYSLLWRGIEYEVRDKCAENGLGIISEQPLANGLLSGRYASVDDYPEERMDNRLFSGARKYASHGGSGAEDEVFMTLEMIRSIAQELDLPMSDLSLAWLLSQPAVTSALTTVRSVEQVYQHAQASDLTLDQTVIESLNDVSAFLKEEMGTNIDQFTGELG